MAAVLCQGIGKACNGVCDCLEAICKAPFRLCGSCCNGLGQCCGDSCQLVFNCCSSEFCCYITVAVVLNVPPIIVGLMDLPNVGSGCQGSLWLLIFWLLCVANIVAAFYMSVAIQRDDSILPNQQSNSHHTVGQNATEGAHRMKQLFCYDTWMAVYILVLCGFFGWLLLGGVWFATGTMDDDEDCDGIHGKVGIAYGFGWAFICVGGCALMTSLCCSFLNPSPSARHPNNNTVPAHVTNPPSNNSNKPTGTAGGGAATANPSAPNNKPTPSAPTENDHIPVAQATIIPETGYGSADDKNTYSKV